MKPLVALARFASSSLAAFVLFVGWEAFAAEPTAPAKPAFLYCRYFNAEGEPRSQPDGTYREVLQRLQAQFEVRTSGEPLTYSSLAGVGVILIANHYNWERCLRLARWAARLEPVSR
jgi:hypothetical protein